MNPTARISSGMNWVWVLVCFLGTVAVPVLAPAIQFGGDGEGEAPLEIPEEDLTGFTIIRKEVAEDPGKEQKKAALKERIKRTILPEVNFENLPLSKAIGTLVVMDPNYKDPISISVLSSALIEKIDKEALKTQKIQPVKELEITLNRKRISIKDALDEICAQTGLQPQFRPEGILLVRANTETIETVSYRYQINMTIFRRILHTAGKTDFVDVALDNLGVTFSEGTEAIFNYQDLGLSIKNSPEQIEVVEQILETITPCKVMSEEEAIRLGLISGKSSVSESSKAFNWWLFVLGLVAVSLAVFFVMKRSRGGQS